MWSAEDVARDSVRRQGKALDLRAVEARLAEAVTRAEEARAVRPAASGLGAPDPERLAAVWAAKRVEWQRVRDLMVASDWEVYEPERDVEGSRCALEREELRRAAVQARAEFEARRRESVVEVRAELWLGAGPSRRVRAAAQRVGLRPAEILAQLAERVVVEEDGTVSVPPFMPSR